jgi:hypothetical protein
VDELADGANELLTIFYPIVKDNCEKAHVLDQNIKNTI